MLYVEHRRALGGLGRNGEGNILTESPPAGKGALPNLQSSQSFHEQLNGKTREGQSELQEGQSLQKWWGCPEGEGRKGQ